MVPRQQSSLSTSAAVRNDVTDCRLSAERSNQSDVPSPRLRSVPPLCPRGRRAAVGSRMFSRQCYVRVCHRPRTGIRCWSFHRRSSSGRDVPGNCEKIAKSTAPRRRCSHDHTHYRRLLRSVHIGFDTRRMPGSAECQNHRPVPFLRMAAPGVRRARDRRATTGAY